MFEVHDEPRWTSTYGGCFYQIVGETIKFWIPEDGDTVDDISALITSENYSWTEPVGLPASGPIDFDQYAHEKE